ncbi:hypothetical protein [Deinococcus hopiensis]|uniref:hypothetical protein n=1 Tax=Deinococcus hopiensis TaxID=309885 RepID=UPI0009FD4337|nr:hypothetical protein [Deinococcus hopiensis]
MIRHPNQLVECRKVLGLPALPEMVECETCEGEGIVQIGPDRDPSQFAHMGTCPDCHGEGEVEA